ncbi:hypothetical protein M405DRAFT_136643 [Rhizopogon salebrosus TDB-379]|nr:hypothetical protein M405DRAFT_136643 [Rhizopogon salebrosus TDB-379]
MPQRLNKLQPSECTSTTPTLRSFPTSYQLNTKKPVSIRNMPTHLFPLPHHVRLAPPPNNSILFLLLYQECHLLPLSSLPYCQPNDSHSKTTRHHPTV